MEPKKNSGMAYNMNKLNRLFFILSIAFLLTVLWVFLDDYLRPWKAVQIEALKIEQEQNQKMIEQAKSKIDQKQLAQMKKKLATAKKAVSLRKEEIEKVEKKIKAVRVKIKAETIVSGRLNSTVAATAFNWEKAHTVHHPGAKKLFSKLQKLKKEFALAKDRMKVLTQREKELGKELAQIKDEETQSIKTVEKMTKSLDALLQSKKQKSMNPVFFLRNLPFIDFLDPTLKIRQVVTENITDDRYFRHVPKVDRCMTCHTFIDRPGYENRPNPYKTHPNLALMVGDKSPHPMKEYGCTTCHGGEGHRVFDFNSVAHTPQNEKQKKRVG